MNTQNVKNALFMLAQSAQEKSLSVVFVSIFLLFVAIFVVDMFAMKKYAGNKIINRIIWVLLVIAIVAFVVIYFIYVKE